MNALTALFTRFVATKVANTEMALVKLQSAAVAESIPLVAALFSVDSEEIRISSSDGKSEWLAAGRKSIGNVLHLIVELRPRFKPQ